MTDLYDAINKAKESAVRREERYSNLKEDS